MAEPERARPLVLVPTYNERENLEAILDAVHVAVPDVHVLVIDDASPDGTGEIAARRAAADDRVHVLHRAGKEGLGRAYLAGFEWFLARDYTHAIEMDADFSHDPAYLIDMLRAADEGADVVVGSRLVPGGGTPDWPLPRRLISRGGSLYARVVLGVKTRDLTTGFVLYRRHVLETLDLGAIRTAGYGFQVEMKYRCLQAGFRVVEIPIVFPDRKLGKSKMTPGIAGEAFMEVLRLRLGR
jgi:dolichol-phosphate mannosyltransferase